MKVIKRMPELFEALIMFTCFFSDEGISRNCSQMMFFWLSFSFLFSLLFFLMPRPSRFSNGMSKVLKGKLKQGKIRGRDSLGKSLV